MHLGLIGKIRAEVVLRIKCIVNSQVITKQKTVTLQYEQTWSPFE